MESIPSLLNILKELLGDKKYIEFCLVACVVYLILTVKSLASQVGSLIGKVTQIDTHISNQKAVDEVMNKFEEKKDEQLKELENRIRALEIRKIK